MSTSYDILPVSAWLKGHRIELQILHIIGDDAIQADREPWLGAPIGSLYSHTNLDPGQLWLKTSGLSWQQLVDDWELSQQVLNDHLDVSVPNPGDGMRLAWDDVQQLWVAERSSSSIGIIAFHYRFGTAVNATPGANYVQMNNVDPALATVVYINEINEDGDDISLFIASLIEGHWLNIYDASDADRHYSFDVAAPVTWVGDVAHVPVSFFSQGGAALTNNLKCDLMFRYIPADLTGELRATGVLDFHNGTFLESFNALATSDGLVVTLSLEQAGGGDLIMTFSDGQSVLDCTPAATIELTAGSDSAPQANYVFIPQGTKALTVSTSSWPSGEHIKVAFLLVPSAVFVQADGVYINQNWNDHSMGTDGQGHMAHMAMRSRRDGAYYFSGIDPNGTDQSAGSSYFNYVGSLESYFKSSAGVIMQMHEHTVPAVDTGSADQILVPNWSGDVYHVLTNLADIVADSEGATLSNRFFNLFFFIVGNKGGEFAPVMCQLPSGSYAKQSDAELDVSGFDNLTMPREYGLDSSTGVAICRMTLHWSGGTSVLSHVSTADLRAENITAGGGSPGALTSFADNLFDVHDESDVSKLLRFDVGAHVSSGVSRLLAVPDADGVVALTPDPDGVVSHADLSNVTAAQHHARYTDAEAVAAVGTIPPPQTYLHEDLTDVTAAQHHARYTDAEAVAAVGDPGDGVYLPLAAGSGSPLTGNLYFGGTGPTMQGTTGQNFFITGNMRLYLTALNTDLRLRAGNGAVWIGDNYAGRGYIYYGLATDGNPREIQFRNTGGTSLLKHQASGNFDIVPASGLMNISGRCTGSDAVNSGDFVTKAQLDALEARVAALEGA